jgi:hypothetical protein
MFGSPRVKNLHTQKIGSKCVELILIRLRIVVSNTYCVEFLLCLSSSSGADLGFQVRGEGART